MTRRRVSLSPNLDPGVTTLAMDSRASIPATSGRGRLTSGSVRSGVSAAAGGAGRGTFGHSNPMRLNVARVRSLLLEVPRTGKLTYCLMRDRRVPLAPKVTVGVALGLIVSPLDVPAWIPVIGDLDVLAMGVLAVKVFVDACPDEVVDEHRAALEQRESVFDQDFRLALVLLRDGVRSLLASPVAERLTSRQSQVSEDEPA